MGHQIRMGHMRHGSGLMFRWLVVCRPIVVMLVCWFLNRWIYIALY